MNPLSIAVNDYLVVSFYGNANVNPVLITGVTPSTVNGQKSYAVVAGGKTYTCTTANTTIREHTAIDTSSNSTPQVTTWVLGA